MPQHHGGTEAPPHDKITQSKTIIRLINIYKRLLNAFIHFVYLICFQKTNQKKIKLLSTPLGNSSPTLSRENLGTATKLFIRKILFGY